MLDLGCGNKQSSRTVSRKIDHGGDWGGATTNDEDAVVRPKQGNNIRHFVLTIEQIL